MGTTIVGDIKVLHLNVTEEQLAREYELARQRLEEEEERALGNERCVRCKRFFWSGLMSHHHGKPVCTGCCPVS